jgi:hypothetical protein
MENLTTEHTYQTRIYKIVEQMDQDKWKKVRHHKVADGFDTLNSPDRLAGDYVLK